MSDHTKIEWTDATWNPVRGCTKITPGCTHCLDPDTMVLMADWTSHPIKELREGDAVVAFDEGIAGVGVNKLYEKATVERVWWTRKPAVRITTNDGGTVIASTDHLFLKPPRGWFRAGNARVLRTRLRRIATAEPVDGMSDDYCAGYIVGATDGDGTMRERNGTSQYREQQWYWRVAVSARQREFIDRLIECAARFGIRLTQKPFNGGRNCGAAMIKVETRKSGEIATLSGLWNLSGVQFSRGYLAGIFDAEGSFGKSGTTRPGSLRISNTNPAYLNAIVAHGTTAGFRFKIENFHGRYCKTARLYGSLDELGRFLGLVRPALTYKKQAPFRCRIEGRTPKVVSVEYVGERELVDIQTSKRTFIANGYMTHNCYAATFAERFRGVPGHPYEQGFDLRLVPEKLRDPFLWTTRKRVFVNSMSDLFHTDVPDDYILRVANVMATANWHTYQVLTKRSERMAELLRTKLAFAAGLPHIWWGVSVENRKHGLPRIDHLRAAPAKVRFLSVEPLLEDLGRVDLTGIHWMIVGGESGPGARPLHADWVRSLRDQCQAVGVSFFFKQWGGVQKSKTGRTLDGRTHDEQPEEEGAVMPARRFRLRLVEECETAITAGCVKLD